MTVQRCIIKPGAGRQIFKASKLRVAQRQEAEIDMDIREGMPYGSNRQTAPGVGNLAAEDAGPAPQGAAKPRRRALRALDAVGKGPMHYSLAVVVHGMAC